MLLLACDMATAPSSCTWPPSMRWPSALLTYCVCAVRNLGPTSRSCCCFRSSAFMSASCSVSSSPSATRLGSSPGCCSFAARRLRRCARRSRASCSCRSRSCRSLETNHSKKYLALNVTIAVKRTHFHFRGGKEKNEVIPPPTHRSYLSSSAQGE